MPYQDASFQLPLALRAANSKTAATQVGARKSANYTTRRVRPQPMRLPLRQFNGVKFWLIETNPRLF